jgi:phage terminase large subunit GpA-like protein
LHGQGNQKGKEEGDCMKYQLTCPKCKHEFAYDNGHIDGEIARLSAEVTSLVRELSEHNLLPKDEQFRRTAWWKGTKVRLAKAHEELAAAKAFRKVADQQVEKFKNDAFKHLVREKIGDEEYIKLMKQAEADCEAYRISGLMRHEYTRSSAKANVTSINKL